MKKVISVIMILVLLSVIFTQVAAVELAAAQSKISSELMTEFHKLGTSETTLAYVEMQDVDHDAVMREFARRYPDEYSVYMNAKYGDSSGETSEEENEQLQNAIELKREIYREFYAAHNQAVLKESVTTDTQVFVSEYAPIAVLEISRGTAMRMAWSDEVLSISEYVESEVSTESDELEDGLKTVEVIMQLDLSNQITRADYLRDTKNLTGSGIKIGILEAEGVPDTTNTFLQNANITIRSGDEVADPHATIVALILAAVSSSGVEHGIVPDAHFYCAKVETDEEMYSDIEWMISQGVNIINASLLIADDRGIYDLRSQWVDHIATVHDVHFVKSAGNNGSGISQPGMAYNAYTVGAFRANGSDNVDDFTMYENSSYVEYQNDCAEKPNLIANGYFGNYIKDGAYEDCIGTSFAAPQVTGVIAQLCCWNGNLKYRQNVVGAVLAASSAEKVNGVYHEDQGYMFTTHINNSEQINEMEGAGILDARWAWGILANQNYWNIKQIGSASDNQIFYEMTITINTNVHDLTRIAIFWTKNNTNINHTNNTLGTNPDLTNFDLYVYNSMGTEIAYSETTHSNFEIVQFKPEAPGEYKIVIKIVGASNVMEYVGLAVW